MSKSFIPPDVSYNAALAFEDGARPFAVEFAGSSRYLSHAELVELGRRIGAALEAHAHDGSACPKSGDPEPVPPPEPKTGELVVRLADAVRVIEQRAEGVSAWIGSAAAGFMISDLKRVATRDRNMAIADRHYIERLALCPDHRDKATGRCIVCQAEERTRQELRRSKED